MKIIVGYNKLYYAPLLNLNTITERPISMFEKQERGFIFISYLPSIFSYLFRSIFLEECHHYAYMSTYTLAKSLYH